MRIADSRNATHLTCEQQGLKWSSRKRAVQSVEGMARTLRLDLLSRTNIAVGSDLPITSRMVRHAAWLWSHFQTASGDGNTAYARRFERPYESLVQPFAERVMWNDPTLQPAKLKKQLGLWFVVGEITDKQRSPHWHESGHRCGSHDSTCAGVRTRGLKSGGGVHEEQTCCRTTG